MLVLHSGHFLFLTSNTQVSVVNVLFGAGGGGEIITSFLGICEEDIEASTVSLCMEKRMLCN